MVESAASLTSQQSLQEVETGPRSLGDAPKANGPGAAESRLNAVFSHTSAGFAQCDLQGRFIFVNDAYCVLVGRSRDELLGMRMQDVTHPEDVQSNALQFHQCLTASEPFIAEKRYVRPDGSIVWVSNSVTAVQGEDGRPSGALAMSLEITERRLAEEARRQAEDVLRASEEFSRSIVESSPDCVKVLDPSGTLQFMNGNGLCAMEIDDFTPFCGQPWKSLWPEESLADIEAALEKARSGGVGRFSAFCPTAKGTPKWWDVIVSPVLDRSGRPERLISVSRDVTELHDARRRLEGERQRLLQLFEQAPGFMAVLRGPEHVFELANATYRQTIGHRDVIGKSAREALPELEGQGYFELLDQVYASGEPFVGRGSRALIQRHPDAPPEEGYFDFIMQPIVEPDGFISGIFIQGHDVTEQVRAKEELQRANEELQRFAYIVSHDLRAPLVNVMGFTGELDAIRKILERDLDEAEKAGRSVRAEVKEVIREDLPEAVRFIRSSTAKMDRLIGAILQLSREGQRVLTPELIRMEELLQSYSQSLAHQLEQNRAELIVESAPDFVADRVATEQIFGNLIENAVKYLMPDRPGRVVVRGQVNGSYVVYEIEDNGRGIEAADHERIFELFRRAGSQEQPGEGIGLAHVRALVRRLGGTIAVASKPGEGTTFTVTLPRTLRLA